MNEDNIIEIIEDILDIDDGSVKGSSTAADLADWDSLATINILVALEGEFGVKFKIDDVQDIRKVSDFFDLVKNYTS